MTIKKIGHCCLYITINNIRILTDPGTYSTTQNDVVGIDFILISHEHTDHCHLDSLKAIMKNNPSAVIITNNAVSALLKKENITHKVVGDRQNFDMNGVSLSGWGTKHAAIYKTAENVENTGYIIDKKLFYPGDAFTFLDEPVDIIALPVAGGWMKLSEAIDYALAMKPKKCFPIHDGNLRRYGTSHRLPKNELTKAGIEFIPLEEGQEAVF
jgi:L-ascorbate metabolism protein UlaG (beta-lactamase superfamily)